MANYETPREFNQPLLTTSEAAKMLNAHPNTVRRWADERLLFCYRIGTRGHRRYPLEELQNFLAVDGDIVKPYARTAVSAS